jgi:hypothetical protein
MKLPFGTFWNVMSSPPAVRTRRIPPVPTYSTQPLLPVPFSVDTLGMSTVSLFVTTDALDACNF